MNNKSTSLDISDIPNLNEQRFKVTEQYVRCGIEKINSPASKTYICKFKQNGYFVSAYYKNQFLGIWEHTSNGWELCIVGDKPDNGMFIFHPTKLSSNNDVIEMTGTIVEAGTSQGPLLKTVNAIYDIMPQFLKKKTSKLYSKISTELRKNISQNLKVSRMTCQRIE